MKDILIICNGEKLNKTILQFLLKDRIILCCDGGVNQIRPYHDPDYIIGDMDSIDNKENFLDEKRYVNSFVRDKFKFNKWGKIKIKYELLKKNINETLVNEALDKSINQQEYLSTLKNLLLEKKKKLKNNDRNAVIQKITNFALSKGYEPQIVRSIVESIIK
jgi:hypothetical protein